MSELQTPEYSQDHTLGAQEPTTPPRRSNRARNPPLRTIHDTFDAKEFTYGDFDDFGVFLTHKELADLELLVKLQKEGIITALGKPFEQSTRKEIKGLMEAGVFKIKTYDDRKHGGVRIFDSRYVHEIKGKTTTPFEKTRLVIQAYQDNRKAFILTQSPTIQRASQRLIATLTPSFLRLGYHLYLRDIVQAYT
jgi:hypothetical protein